MSWRRWRSSTRSSTAGFTLIEVLVALAILVVSVLSVTTLFATAVRAIHSARDETSAETLAMEKIEALNALAWGVDAMSSALVTDTTTDLSVDPPASTGRGLAASPANTLDVNVPGYVDYLDTSGQWVGTGATAPPSAMFIRRWRIQPLLASPETTIVFQVFVTTVVREQARAARGGGGARTSSGEDALVTSVRTRTARVQ